MGTEKYFFEIYRQFGHAPSERFSSPESEDFSSLFFGGSFGSILSTLPNLPTDILSPSKAELYKRAAILALFFEQYVTPHLKISFAFCLQICTICSQTIGLFLF
jgi:hypothetical protein